MVKLIANERIHKTEAGGELEVADNVGKVLVLLGKAKYVEGHEPVVTVRVPNVTTRRRTRSTGGPVGAVTSRTRGNAA